MKDRPLSRSIALLRLVLVIVVVVQSLRTAIPHAAVQSHAAHGVEADAGFTTFVRALAVVEILAALLMLLPRMARIGGIGLLGVFAVAVALHLILGEWAFGPLLVYAAATLVVLVAGGSSQPSDAPPRTSPASR